MDDAAIVPGLMLPYRCFFLSTASRSCGNRRVASSPTAEPTIPPPIIRMSYCASVIEPGAKRSVGQKDRIARIRIIGIAECGARYRVSTRILARASGKIENGHHSKVGSPSLDHENSGCGFNQASGSGIHMNRMGAARRFCCKRDRCGL